MHREIVRLNLFVAFKLIVTFLFISGCGNSNSMKEMATDWCMCAEGYTYGGLDSARVMDSCSSRFMNYEKYPVFFYINRGDDGPEISSEEFARMYLEYDEFCDYRIEICGM